MAFLVKDFICESHRVLLVFKVYVISVFVQNIYSQLLCTAL